MSKARELADVIGTQGTTEQVLSGRRNWIINGDFQVSQRGDFATSPVVVSNDNYSVDRWQHAGYGYATVQKLNGYLRMSSNQSTNHCFYTQQKVEDFGKRFNGQTITISGKCNTNSSNLRLWMFEGSAWSDKGSITGDFSFTFTYVKQDSYDHSGIRFAISDPSSPNVATSIANGEYFELSEVQLELGSVATPFEHRSYGEELALCQRYYQYHGNNQQMLIGWSYCGTNEHCWGSFQFPKMRVAPTATYTGQAHSNCAGDITVSGIATTPSSLEYMNIAPTSLPAGYFVSVPNLWLDAEL